MPPGGYLGHLPGIPPGDAGGRNPAAGRPHGPELRDGGVQSGDSRAARQPQGCARHGISLLLGHRQLVLAAALENVKGPANYASLVGALACLLKNPNLCTDTYSQRSNELEIKAITALANLLFYHTDDPWAYSRWVGRSRTCMARASVWRRCSRGHAARFERVSVAAIVSEAGHYSNQTVAGWLGIGTENLEMIPTDEAMAMRLDKLEEALERLHGLQKRVAYVVATFAPRMLVALMTWRASAGSWTPLRRGTAFRHPNCTWMRRWAGS